MKKYKTQPVRQYLRVSIIEPVKVYDIVNDKTSYGTISNVSPGGLGIISKRSINIGNPVALEFELPPMLKYQRISGNVVRIHKMKGQFYLGIAFSNLNRRLSITLQRFVASRSGEMLKSAMKGKII